MINIQNPTIKELYEYYTKAFNNQNNDINTRIKVKRCMDLIEACVVIYERKEELDEEEIEDLKVRYNEGFRPAFPEDIKRIYEKNKK